MTPARANLALFATAAVLLAAALPWSSMVLGSREEHSRAAAEAALDRIAAREQASSRRGYVPFGPGPGERDAALPGLDLGTAEAEFAFDATPEAAGALRLRAVSRPDAVASGRVIPLLRARVLARGAELGHEGRDADPPGRAAATR